MSSEVVSFIIPCYNSSQWIASAIQSALDQSWPEVEIIVVDDSSTDSSYEIAAQYASSQVKVLRQPHRGASAARNRALSEARGEFLQYLDADDLIATDKIALQMGVLTENPDSICSGAWGSFTSEPETAQFVRQDVWQESEPTQWLIRSWLGGGMMPPASWLIPRHIVEKAGPWNESLSLNDDGEYFCRVLLASKKVLFCEEAKSFYRKGHAGRLSARQTGKAWESALSAIKLSTEHLLAQRDDITTRSACAAAYMRFAYSAYPYAPALVAEAEKAAIALGGTDLLPEGGKKFQFFRKILGWKGAMNLEQLWRRYN